MICSFPGFIWTDKNYNSHNEVKSLRVAGVCDLGPHGRI